MAEYKSEITPLRGSAETVYAKLSNLGNLRGLLDRIPMENIPDDKRSMFENVTITDDSISIPLGAGAPMGALTFRKDRCVEPTLVRLVGVGTPVPLALEMHITPLDEHSSEGQVVVDVNIPMMLKPMVSGPIGKVVSQFSDVLKAIPFDA